MAAVTGILLDVSGSMRENVSEVEGVEGGPWARSIFQVIDDLIKHDLSPENKVFAHAFGAHCEKSIFDILGTVKRFQNRGVVLRDADVPATYENIEEAFKVLETHGANSIRDWVQPDVIQSAVQDYLITLVLSELKSNKSFRDNFIKNILPPACRIPSSSTINKSSAALGAVTLIAGTVLSFGALVPVLAVGGGSVVAYNGVVNTKKATKEDVLEIVRKVKSELLETPNQQSIIAVHEALRIVHGCLDNEELSVERSKELHKLVEPFIYGRTPLYRSLKNSEKLFQSIKISTGMKKMLFVLSDGLPGDIDISNEQAISKVRSDLSKQDIIVVSCFISDEKVICPKKLYSNKEPDWRGGANFLFTLSSVVPTEILPRVILLKRGWDIDVSNNETKLFMQVSHPDNVREACDLARNAVCSQEALSDLLVSVSLDIYINQSREAFKAPYQEGATCYANASATVLHLSMKRILGRDNGYPKFDDIRNDLISRYENDREKQSTWSILQDVCPEYRLHCEEVKLKGAMKAITEKRPVVATFRYTKSEMDIFNSFFGNNPTGILSKSEINIKNRQRHEKILGHAVVLTSFNSQCLRFMNSWGENWADMGFFRVKSSDVLNFTFIDVYWTKDDLSDREKDYYTKHGSGVSHTLMKALIGLQKQTYTCPLFWCCKTSLVTEFTGTLNRAVCPRCGGEFSSNGAGNILALNMYLTSLAR